MTQQPNSQSAYRTPRRWLRWVVLALMILAAAIAWRLIGTAPKEPKHKGGAVIISVTPARHDDFPVYLQGLGTVQAFNTVTIHSRIDGQLMALPFTEGQIVKAGDTIAQLDDRVYEAQYHQALANKVKSEAQLANARIDLARYKNLGDSVSRQVRDTQQSSVRQFEAAVMSDTAAVETAKTQLSYATITSPISGRTGIRQVDVGNLIRAGDANGIVTVTQIEPISVLFSLPQKHLDAINAQLVGGKPLTVQTMHADGKTVTDSGQLELVDNQIDPSTGTIRLKATFPNKAHQLWPGGFTNVRLLLSTNKDAVVIPTVAIQHGPQGAYVFVYKKDAATTDTQTPAKDGTGRVLLTPVDAGMAVDDNTQIISGLSANDLVVVDGMAKLQDKKRVKLKDDAHAPTNASRNANMKLASSTVAAAPVTAVESKPLSPKKAPTEHRNGE